MGRTPCLSPSYASTSAGKPIDASKRDLTVHELDIRKETTLTLNGSLKGGFGERAAAEYIRVKGIKRGNVRADAEETKDISSTTTDYLRAFQKDLRVLAAQIAGITNDKNTGNAWTA